MQDGEVFCVIKSVTMEHMDITVPTTAVFIVYMIICATNKLVTVTGVVTRDILIVTVKKSVHRDILD